MSKGGVVSEAQPKGPASEPDRTGSGQGAATATDTGISAGRGLGTTGVTNFARSATGGFGWLTGLRGLNSGLNTFRPLRLRFLRNVVSLTPPKLGLGLGLGVARDGGEGEGEGDGEGVMGKGPRAFDPGLEEPVPPVARAFSRAWP